MAEIEPIDCRLHQPLVTLLGIAANAQGITRSAATETIVRAGLDLGPAPDLSGYGPGSRPLLFTRAQWAMDERAKFRLSAELLGEVRARAECWQVTIRQVLEEAIWSGLLSTGLATLEQVTTPWERA